MANYLHSKTIKFEESVKELLGSDMKLDFLHVLKEHEKIVSTLFEKAFKSKKFQQKYKIP